MESQYQDVWDSLFERWPYNGEEVEHCWTGHGLHSDGSAGGMEMRILKILLSVN